MFTIHELILMKFKTGTS